MSQAKVLNQQEIDKVLAFVSTRRFAMRNRVILLCSFWSGMRAKELSCLTVGSVMNADGTVKNEVRLTAEQTKGRHSRTVFLPQKLQVEIQRYLDIRRVTDMDHPLFVTAGGKAFTPNLMSQHFFWMYKKVGGLEGASSHSGRRSFATKIAQSGANIKLLQKLLGHQNVQTTMVYVSVNDEMLRNCVELA
jgi:integrase/recombinase XerD